jgi:hypothetical protein
MSELSAADILLLLSALLLLRAAPAPRCSFSSLFLLALPAARCCCLVAHAQCIFLTWLPLSRTVHFQRTFAHAEVVRSALLFPLDSPLALICTAVMVSSISRILILFCTHHVCCPAASSDAVKGRERPDNGAYYVASTHLSRLFPNLLPPLTSFQMVELKSGDSYNGTLVAIDHLMNLHLRDVTCTSADGQKFWKANLTHIHSSMLFTVFPVG